ncbi:DUF3373 family protein [Thiovibrio sp. JS02]
MVKKISTLALAGLLALPAMASAGAGSTSDMQSQIDALTKQLEQLKAQMANMKTAPAAAPAGDLSERVEALEDRSEAWDLSSRIQFSGDFRARMDYVTADTPAHYEALNVARGVNDVLLAGSSSNVDALLGAFAMTTATDLTVFAGALQVTPVANFIAAADAAFQANGSTAAEAAQYANDLAAIFYHSEVGTMLGAMPAGTTVGDVTSYFGSAQSLVGFMKNLSPAARAAIFSSMSGAYDPTAAQDYDNDTIWTNRFRMDMRVKALENVEFKGRVAMYKAWGMQNNPVDYSYNNGMGGGPFALGGYMTAFDGATTRNPSDSILRVDRAFVNWNNIADSPVWFSIGRRPTTDGPPANLKLGSDERMATPTAVMDWPFDGISVGYAYNDLFGQEDMPGRVRVCYGRGFESGPDSDSNRTLNDVDFAGVSWDIYKKGNRFFYLQSFGAFNVFNVPDNVNFANPLEYAAWEVNNDLYDPLDPSQDLLLNRANLGDIYHTSGVYMDKYDKLNYFVGAAWSKTNAQGMDELGTSLLGEWWEDPTNRDGYHFHAGVRYDLDDYGLKLGLEYNWGSEYWIAMSPGHDDLYQSKLATRGDVWEVYGIYDIPGGEAISKFGKAWMRLGYQHYEYDYTGSGFWLGAPHKVEDLANDPLYAQFYTPIESMDQVYLTFEAAF